MEDFLKVIEWITLVLLVLACYGLVSLVMDLFSLLC